MLRHSSGTSTRRGRSPRSAACRIIAPTREREPMSAQRLAFDVIRSVASATLASSSQSTRAAVSRCIVSVDGVNPRIACIATVLSVKEYTWDAPERLQRHEAERRCGQLEVTDEELALLLCPATFDEQHLVADDRPRAVPSSRALASRVSIFF